MSRTHEIIMNSLNGTSDAYVVDTGKASRFGAGVALRIIEVDLNEEPEAPVLNGGFQNEDPQPPRLMTYEELAETIHKSEAAAKEEHMRDTGEFEQITGHIGSKKV